MRRSPGSLSLKPLLTYSVTAEVTYTERTSQRVPSHLLEIVTASRKERRADTLRFAGCLLVALAVLFAFILTLHLSR